MASDLFYLIRSEHQAQARLLEELESEARRGGAADATRAKGLLTRLAELLGQHFTAEERFFYPLLTRSGLGDHRDQARKLADEHEEAAGLLCDLSAVAPEHAGFEEGVAAVAGLLRHHWADEEARVFPHVRATIPADELAVTARRWAQLQQAPSSRPELRTESAPGAP